MAEPSESDVDDSYSSLRSITHGASVYFLGTGVNHALGFIFNLLIPRAFGAELYGVYTYGYTLALIGSRIAKLGTGTAALKFIPQYGEDRSAQNRVLGLIIITSLVGGIVVGGALYIFAPLITDLTLGNPLLTDVLRVFAFFVPAQALTQVVISVFQSLELPGHQMAIKNGVMPILRLLAAGVALLLGATIVGLTAAVVVASVLTLGVGVVLILSRTSLRPARGNSKADAAEFYKFSVPLTFQKIGTVLYKQIDLLMVGIFLTGNAVGIYKISTVLASLMTLALSGVNQLFPPIASRLYTNQKLAELESLYCRVTRWIFTFSLFPSIAVIIYNNEILRIFGLNFTNGGPVLVLFIIAQLTNAAVGPSNYVLIMTNHQNLAVVNEWIIGILNVVFNFIFIQYYGLIGAALATASVLAGVNVLRLIEVWYTEQLYPYSLKFIKPLIAGFAAGLVMFGLRTILSGYVLLFAGGAIGAVVFISVLIALGIEQEDREFIIELAPTISS